LLLSLEQSTQVSTRQLDEVLNDNKQLKEQNQRLQSLLKVVRDGDRFSSMSESRKKPSTRDNESSSSIVSNSSSLMSPFVNTRELKKKEICPLSLKPAMIPPL
jgi:hypothetical protein